MFHFPHSKQWFKQLAASHGNQLTGSIISRAQDHYDQLLTGDLALRYSKTKNQTELRNLVFPAVAIYWVLSDLYKDNARVLSIIEGLFKQDFFRGMGLGIGYLNNLRNPFPVFRFALRKMIHFQSPAGYQVILEDKPDRFVINAVRCFKLEVLTELGARELTTLYCKTDDWLSEKLPKVHWQRTKTLAAGDDICDFCWSWQA